jgi:hypothetical protein
MTLMKLNNEFMSRYSIITNNRLLLPIENFDTLSYGVILDHLKIQSMNDIA